MDLSHGLGSGGAGGQPRAGEPKAIVARARAECVAAGTDPLHYATLMLEEALLAMMVHGLDQAECRRRLAQFSEQTVPEWFAMADRSAERCDCAREHAREVACGDADR